MSLPRGLFYACEMGQPSIGRWRFGAKRSRRSRPRDGSRNIYRGKLDSPKVKAEQFTSLISVLRQAVSVAITQNERRSISQADLVITVNTQKYSQAITPKQQI